MFKNCVRFFLAALVFFSTLCVNAQSAKEYFDLGRRAYEKGDFAAAAQNFTSSAEIEANAASLHNAANAYVKISKPGLARLYYERANYLNPRSPETRMNLAAIQKEVGQQTKYTIFDTIFAELSSAEWTWILIVSIWGAILCFFVLSHFFKKHARILNVSGCLFAGMAAFSLVGCVYWYNKRQTAIAVSPDILLRISPAAHAPASHAMADGKNAKIIKRSGNYVLLEFPEQKYGWAKNDEVIPIWPMQKK